MKGQFEQQKLQMQAEGKAMDAHLKQQTAQVQTAMKVQQHAVEMKHKQLELAANAEELKHRNAARMAQSQGTQVQAAQQVVHTEQKHQQQMRHSEEKAKLAAQQQKNSARGKTKPSPKR